MKSALKWNELSTAGFRRMVIANTIPTSRYQVSKPDSVEWPEDVELISFCDGGTFHFGGNVKSTTDKNIVRVDVYVD